jgi:hypothetical protein
MKEQSENEHRAIAAYHILHRQLSIVHLPAMVRNPSKSPISQHRRDGAIA